MFALIFVYVHLTGGPNVTSPILYPSHDACVAVGKEAVNYLQGRAEVTEPSVKIYSFCVEANTAKAE